MDAEYHLADLCAALSVTRSGYHAWAGRQPGPRAQANAALLLFIEQAQLESRRTYGSPRVHQWLQQHGQACGRHRVARLIRSPVAHNFGTRPVRVYFDSLFVQKLDLKYSMEMH